MYRQAAALLLGIALLGAIGWIQHPATAESPLARTPEPAALAALAAVRDGNERRSLLRLAGALGWRDPPTQLALLADAAAASDAKATMTHAEALLRLEVKRDEVGDMLVANQHMPGMAGELAAALADAPFWARTLLRDHGARFDDPVLEAVATARARAGNPFDAGLTAGLSYKLAEQGRVAMAQELACRLPGFACADRLPGWPPSDRFQSHAAFAWRMGNDYMLEPDCSGGPCVRPVGAPERPLSILLALPEGRYHLAFPDNGGQPAEGWFWAFSCGTEIPRPDRVLRRVTALAVPGDCPLQTLSLGPLATPAGPLPAPALEPLE